MRNLALVVVVLFGVTNEAQAIVRVGVGHRAAARADVRHHRADLRFAVQAPIHHGYYRAPFIAQSCYQPLRYVQPIQASCGYSAPLNYYSSYSAYSAPAYYAPPQQYIQAPQPQYYAPPQPQVQAQYTAPPIQAVQAGVSAQAYILPDGRTVLPDGQIILPAGQ